MTLVLYDQVKREDYEDPANRQLVQITTTLIEFVTNDKGYQSLVRNIDNLPQRYEPLINNLNQIFINDKIMVERFNKSISDITDGILKDWETNFPWYSNLMTGAMKPEALDYFYQNPFYKNHVTSYSIISIQNHLPTIENYRVDAIESYKAINELLGLEPDESAIESFLIPFEKLENLVGTYGPKDGFNVTVTTGDQGQLLAQASGQASLELYPLSPIRFSAVGIPFMLGFSLGEGGLGKEIIIYQGSSSTSLSRN